MYHKKILYILLISLVVISFINAQPGKLDPAFNTIGSFNATVLDSKVQSDGKIIVVGNFTNYHTNVANGICRLNSDGTFDETFLTGTGIKGNVYCIEILSTGKILLGGIFISYNGTVVNSAPIIRLNSDGTLDNTFNSVDNSFTGPKFMGSVSVRDLLIQASGKIVAVGEFDFTIKTYTGPSTYTTYVIQDIIRLNANGSYDNTFHIGTGSNSTFPLVAVKAQSNGSLIIGGNFTQINGISRSKICRLDSEGNLDNTFNPVGAGNYGGVQDLDVTSNDKIIVVGNFTSFNNQSLSNIVKLMPDGSLDNSFSCTPSYDLWQVEIQSDDKYIIAGIGQNTLQGQTMNNVIRINTDGSVDNSFTHVQFNLYGSNTYYAVTLQPDGKILVGREFSSYANVTVNNLVRLNADGTVDVSFIHARGADGPVTIAKTLADGKVLLGGEFQLYNSEIHRAFCRVHADGTIDATFNAGDGFHFIALGTDFPRINSITLQNDGKYLVAGFFDQYDGVERHFMVRINPDGSIDNSLQAYGVNFGIRHAIIQPDDKIIAVGDFNIFFDYDLSNITANRIIRMHHDGSLDYAFNAQLGTAANQPIYRACLQPNGKILIGGYFTTFNGTTANYIKRLNSDGSVDNTFTGTGANGFVKDIQLLADGRILIVGNFTSYNGTTVSGLAILKDDGTIDPAFTNLSHDGTITSAYQQTDQKLLVSGNFTQYGSAPHLSIVRLGMDGSLDASFSSPAYSFGIGNIQAYDADHVLITTTLYDNYTINGICRINSGGITTSTDSPDNEEALSPIIFPNPLQGSVIHISTNQPYSDHNEVTIYNATGNKVYTRINIPFGTPIQDIQLPKGLYVFKLNDYENNTAFSNRLIIE